MSLPYRAIGLGGGGVKGILHVGALLELAKHQELKFPDGVYGCSIGSILATYIAFELPIQHIVPLMNEYLSMEKITPTFKLEYLSSVFSSKGLYPMTHFESAVTDMFQKAGLDIGSKRIGDSPMPLYIVSSNITKGVPTLFSKDIRIIDALKCSCCIPGIFRPVELYGQLYVDGNLFTPCISEVIPTHALGISLLKQRKHSVTHSLLDSMSPLSYVNELYTMTSRLFHNACVTENTLCLSYPNLHSDSDLAEFNTDEILQKAGFLLNEFVAKRSG